VTPAEAVAYLPLARARAGRAAIRLPAHIELDDLVQEASIGLLQAASRFDPSRGLSFATLARHRIDGAVLDYLRREDPLSRRQRRECAQLDITAIGPEALHLADPGPGPDDIAAQHEHIAAAARLLERLDDRSRFVATATLRGAELQDQARTLGVSPARVGQILAGVIQRLEASTAC
jgi:RNA polymerase sigma factor (sigma-70 family)